MFTPTERPPHDAGAEVQKIRFYQVMVNRLLSRGTKVRPMMATPAPAMNCIMAN